MEAKMIRAAIAAICVAAAFPSWAADTVINLNGGSQTGSFNNRGPITGSYTIHGPGTFTSTGRVYPNNLSHIVTFDQGAVVWLTTHNPANDGLIVSGNQQCEVRLGNCTVGSCKDGYEICLARYVTLVLTDSEVGTTITTRNLSGTPIVMQTAPSQQAIIKGSGKLNLVGGGTFRFDDATKFENTGLITVDAGTTASINTTVPKAPLLVKRGGILDLGAGAATITFAKGVTFEGGSVLRMTVGATARRILDTKPTAWNAGNAVYFPHNDGAKVTISPVEGTGLAAGRYTIVNNVAECGIEAFLLDKTTLGGFNLSLDLDGDALVLVVSEDEISTSAVWSGGMSGAFGDANWDAGETFPEGKGARFATPGATIALDADSPSVRRLAFAESATISGTGTLNVSNGDFFVEAGCTATLDVPLAIRDSRIRKYGAGTLVITAAKQSTIYDIVSFEGQVELRLSEGETVTVPKIGNEYRRVGGLSYIGPGTFTSFRLYPRNYGSTNVVDGGATVVLTGNSASDGVIVSGWRDGEDLSRAGAVALGDCTIRSGYSSTTLLTREVNIVLTDPVNGTTISTDGANGSPITVTTEAANRSGAFYGSGKLNVAGSGKFLFGAGAKFHQTGETVVKDGATALLDNDVPHGAFTVESGGMIAGCGGLPRRIGALALESGAAFGTPDYRSIIVPATFTCAAGATFDFVVGTASAGGVPLLDLRGASLSIGAGSTVRVVLNGAMPNGTYDFIWFDAADAAQIANLSFTFVDGTGSGCTGAISVSDGVARLVVGGSSAAARNVWRGLGADGAWSTALNWTAQEAPVTGGALEFSGTNGLVNVNDTGRTAFSSLSFTSNAGAFDIDLAGAGQGMATIANSSGNKQIVRNYVNTGALEKSGSKEVELVDPVVGGKLTMASGAPLAIRSTEGNTVTVNSNGGSWSSGTFRYLGPGAFLTSRIYPNSSSVPVSFEDGAMVWIITHNTANDGLIVAAGTDRVLKAGYSTIGSRFDGTTELLRAVSIEFANTGSGTTITTDNVNGNPITITTKNKAGANDRNKGYFKGKGRINISGHGTFEFDPQTTFLHTGTTFIDADATAVVTANVGYTNSAITVAGKLRLEGGIVSKRVTVQNGGVIENPGAATVSGGVSLADGAKMVLPVAADGTVTKAQCAIIAPSSGTATVELACASRSLPKKTPIVLTQGAGLAAGAEAKFAVTPVFGGAPVPGIKVKTSVSSGELCVEFISKGILIIVK